MKLEVEKYIKELLIESDCVVIPNFGTFVSEHNSAQIHPITHLFTPPSKTITFDAKLFENDEYLINSIVIEANLAKNEVLSLLEDFVLSIKNILNSGKKYVFDGIGKFSKNETDAFIFEHAEEKFPCSDAFGMTEFFAKPIEREDSIKLRNSNTMTTPQQPARRPVGTPRPGQPVMRKKKPATEGLKKVGKPTPIKPKKEGKGGGGMKVILYLIPVVLLLGAGGYFITSHDNMDFASLNPLNMMGLGGEEEVVVEKSTSLDEPVVAEVTEIESESTNMNSEEWTNEETGEETLMEESPIEESAWNSEEENNTSEEEENVEEEVANITPIEEEVKDVAVEEVKDAAVEEVKELGFIEQILAWIGWSSDEVVDGDKEDVLVSAQNGWADDVVEPTEEVVEDIATEEDELVVEEDIAEDEKTEEKVNYSSGETTISTRTDRYYVIAGAFGNPQNAQNYRQELADKGYDSKVLVPRGVKNVHRVTIADYSTQNEGILKSQAENEDFGFALWVLKY